MITFDDLLSYPASDGSMSPILDVEKLNKLSPEEYDDMLKDFYECIFDDYWNMKDINVIFRFTKDFEKEMTFSQALLLMIFWVANIKYKVKITKDYYVDTNGLVANKISKHLNYIVGLLVKVLKNKMTREQITDELMGDYFTEVTNWTYLIGKNACYPQAQTMSISDIYALTIRNKRMDEITHMHFPDTLPAKETEDRIIQIKDEIMDILREDKFNELYPLIESGKVNNLQLTQLLCQIGYRSDIDKKLLPYPTNTSFLNGFQNAAHYINESMVGRDAELTKKNTVRKSGDFSRKIDLLTINLKIDYDTEDCKTLHTLPYKVKNKFRFKMIVGKYMLDEDDKLVVIKEDDFEKLEGKTIRLRSITCCAINNLKTKKIDDGYDYVCKTCFGSNADMVNDTMIGGLPSVEAINPFTNKAMSIKHQTLSKAADIENSVLNRFFCVDTDEVYIDSDKKINKFYKNAYIRLNREFEESLEETDSDSDTDLLLKEVYLILNYGTDEEQIHRLDDDFEGIYLLLSEDVSSRDFKTSPDSEYILIDLDKFNPEKVLFNISLANEDVAYYLRRLMRIIDGVSIRTYPSLEVLVSDIIDIIDSANVGTGLTNIETIVYKLIRDAADPRFRPDFRQVNPKIAFKTLTESVLTSSAVTDGLVFRNITKQLSTAFTFDKNGSSVYDPFFKTDILTTKLREYVSKLDKIEKRGKNGKNNNRV